MLGPSPTGAYILLRLRHARHCRPGAAAPPTAFAARGRHPSRGIPVSLFPFLGVAYARGLQGCRRNTPLARSLALSSPFLPHRVLRSRTSLAANPSVNDALLPRESTRKTTTATPALAPGASPTQPRPSLSLESPQGPKPGLTLQGAACDHGEALSLSSGRFSCSSSFCCYFSSVRILPRALAAGERLTAQSIR